MQKIISGFLYGLGGTIAYWLFNLVMGVFGL